MSTTLTKCQHLQRMFLPMTDANIDSQSGASLFDQGLSERQRLFLEQVVAQPTIEKALRAAHVGERTYAEWCSKEPAFGQALRVARAIVLDRRVDRMREVAENEPDVQRAKLIIDTDKWLASKIIPHVYGERLDINVSATVNIADALSEARNRALVRPMRDPVDAEEAQVIDSTCEQVPGEIDKTSTDGHPDIFS